jgi:uncharacterized protein DUF6200
VEHTHTAPVNGEVHLNAAIATPVVVDLGSAKKNDIKLLEKGEGPLTEKVLTLLEELRSDGTVTGAAQPVIVVVKRKTTRKSLLSTLLQG